MRWLCPGATSRAALLGTGLVLIAIVGMQSPAVAEPLGSLTGTITGSGRPVPNAWVTLLPVTPTGGWAGQPVQTTTDQEGRYTFPDLRAELVRIQARAPAFSGLASVYWPGVFTFADAGTVRVAASGTSADLELPPGASITGRVVDAETGEPLVGARVSAKVDAPHGWETVGSTGLGADRGQFEIEGLPPVPVTLQARAPDGSNHLGQWYDGAGFHDAADRVQPGSTGVVIRLRAGAQVAGVVRDDLGQPVPGAVVTLRGCPVLCPMVDITDKAGAYLFTAVPPGPLLRAFADAPGTGLLGRWYTAPGQDGETGFGVASGQSLVGLDFTLTAGALIRGRVVDGQTGASIPGVSVVLEDLDNPMRSFLSTAAGSPGEGPATAAVLTIGPVPPGRYALLVQPGRDNGDYLPVQWLGSSGLDSAGLDGAGLIDLERGEHAEIVVRLARQRETGPGVGADPPEAPGGGGVVTGSAQWPGLFGGFLDPEGTGLLPRDP